MVSGRAKKRKEERKESTKQEKARCLVFFRCLSLDVEVEVRESREVRSAALFFFQTTRERLLLSLRVCSARLSPLVPGGWRERSSSTSSEHAARRARPGQGPGRGGARRGKHRRRRRGRKKQCRRRRRLCVGLAPVRGRFGASSFEVRDEIKRIFAPECLFLAEASESVEETALQCRGALENRPCDRKNSQPRSKKKSTT